MSAMLDIFDAENHFYLHCDPSRIGKFYAHAKLYESTVGLPGHFIEVGVFRGASFCRFRKIGKLLHPDHNRMFLGFDVFGKFPEADFDADRTLLEEMNAETGDTGIDDRELMRILEEQSLAGNVELIKGDVRETLPDYLDRHQEMTFAFANIDVDLYDPVKVTMEQVFPRVARGGVILLDDYEGFPGAKKAVDDYLAANGRPERIRKLPFAFSPCHIVKE